MINQSIYQRFLKEVIDDGMIAARSEYDPDISASELEGSLQGFEDCKGKTPEEIASIYLKAQMESRKYNPDEIKEDKKDEYQRLRCRVLEIEWVLNVVSGFLFLVLHQPPLIPVTARGMMKAINVVGNVLGQLEYAHE